MSTFHPLPSTFFLRSLTWLCLTHRPDASHSFVPTAPSSFSLADPARGETAADSTRRSSRGPPADGRSSSLADDAEETLPPPCSLSSDPLLRVLLLLLSPLPPIRLLLPLLW